MTGIEILFHFSYLLLLIALMTIHMMLIGKKLDAMHDDIKKLCKEKEL